jgi:hypothetical protein
VAAQFEERGIYAASPLHAICVSKRAEARAPRQIDGTTRRLTLSFPSGIVRSEFPRAKNNQLLNPF